MNYILQAVARHRNLHERTRNEKLMQLYSTSYIYGTNNKISYNKKILNMLYCLTHPTNFIV
jgi:hypothetical protein